MSSLPRRILDNAEAQPEATPLCPAALQHLGNRAAIDQALSRLARGGRLMRICQGVYMRPVNTRFGSRAPAVEKVVAALSSLWGDTIVPCGGSAANMLGLTSQVPVRLVYLTSGPSRRLRLGRQAVVLRHAPRWQLTAPDRLAGRAIRALAWRGPSEAEDCVRLIARELPPEDLAELCAARAVMPAWMARAVSQLLVHG